MHGEFAGARAEQVSLDADKVAGVEQLEEREAVFADFILLDVDLQLSATLRQVSESGLAHQANRRDAAGNADFHARALELFRRFRRVLGQDLRNLVRGLVLVGITLLTERLDLRELLAALLIDFLFQGHVRPRSRKQRLYKSPDCRLTI